MKEILIIILLISLIYTVIKIFYLKNDIKNINSNLRLIKNNDTNKRITSVSMDKDIVDLIKDINYILDENIKNKIKYEMSSKKLKSMITNISHDLRTPLTSIKGYIEYVNSKPMNEYEIKKYLKIVNDKAILLQELLNSLFELSRIEEEKYLLEISKININNLLVEVLFTFYEDFNMKGIEPILNIKEENLIALGDKKAIKRIFVNLLQNILKHNGKDVEINLYSNEKFIIIDFKNKTDRLVKEDINNLYDRFFTSNKVRSNKSSGLGLTIAKKLVEQMNGETKATLNNGILCISVKLLAMF